MTEELPTVWIVTVFNWETEVQHFTDEAEARAFYDSIGTCYKALSIMVEATVPSMATSRELCTVCGGTAIVSRPGHGPNDRYSCQACGSRGFHSTDPRVSTAGS